MTLVDDFLEILFSFNFYIFLWIILIILTFFLLRRVLRDYKHERMVENSKKLVESEAPGISLSEIQFYLERDDNLLDRYFRKGETELKDYSVKNSPLFQSLFYLINSQIPRKEFVLLLASEMNKIRKRNQESAESLGYDLNAFIDNPEDWVNRFIIVVPEREKQLTLNLRAIEQLHKYCLKFIEVIQIPELSFFPQM